MKALLTIVLGVVFVASPALAQSIAPPAKVLGHKSARRHVKSASHMNDDNGTFRVVVGSDVKITASGEVLVPPTSIITVHEQPAPVPPPAAKAPANAPPHP